MKGRQPLTGLGCALCLELAALAAPPSARSWGCEGHQIVALVAERHLSVHAQREVAALLGPLDTVRRQEEVPRRKSRGRGCNVDLDAFARASIWADEIRASRPATASWHFLDLPRGKKDARKAESFCGRSGCVTRAIREQVAILQEEGANPAQRAEALRFVIHFVGDLHQPLHCATNNDRGGNCVPVDFFGRESRQSLRSSHADYEPNLHALWDSYILRRSRGRRRVISYANALEQKFQTEIASWLKADFELDNWAWESFELAQTEAYGKLPTPIPVERPEPVASCRDANDVGERMAALHEAVGEPYQARAAAVVDEQLAKAGARLALVLNRVWP
ncbi:MAG TPA: S1/P1 nuclease [Myxococcota bacterium]|nr:S1/P1 nuclease [Myxococcota bacterium]